MLNVLFFDNSFNSPVRGGSYLGRERRLKENHPILRDFYPIPRWQEGIES